MNQESTLLQKFFIQVAICKENKKFCIEHKEKHSCYNNNYVGNSPLHKDYQWYKHAEDGTSVRELI